jgi:hypothetical protein
MGWMEGVRFTVGVRDVYHLHRDEAGTWAHIASYLIHVGSSLHKVYSSWEVKLSTCLHLVLRSRMVGLHIRSPVSVNGINTGTTLLVPRLYIYKKKVKLSP